MPESILTTQDKKEIAKEVAECVMNSGHFCLHAEEWGRAIRATW